MDPGSLLGAPCVREGPSQCTGQGDPLVQSWGAKDHHGYTPPCCTDGPGEDWQSEVTGETSGLRAAAHLCSQGLLISCSFSEARSPPPLHRKKSTLVWSEDTRPGGPSLPARAPLLLLCRQGGKSNASHRSSGSCGWSWRRAGQTPGLGSDLPAAPLPTSRHVSH